MGADVKAGVETLSWLLFLTDFNKILVFRLHVCMHVCLCMIMSRFAEPILIVIAFFRLRRRFQ